EYLRGLDLISATSSLGLGAGRDGHERGATRREMKKSPALRIHCESLARTPSPGIALRERLAAADFLLTRVTRIFEKTLFTETTPVACARRRAPRKPHATT